MPEGVLTVDPSNFHADHVQAGGVTYERVVAEGIAAEITIVHFPGGAYLRGIPEEYSGTCTSTGDTL